MKKSILFAVCALMLTACTTKEEVVVPESQAVKFYPTITRATETQFEDGDQISVFAVQPSAGTALKASGNYADNVCYTYNDGVFTSETPITLPLDGAGLVYYAVYPRQFTLGYKGYFDVRANQSDHAAITASDFCSVNKYYSGERDVYLKFWHRLSRICIYITDGNLASRVSAIRLKNVYYRASFDLNDSIYTADPDGGRIDIKMGKSLPNRFEAILPPQTILANTAVVVTIDGKEYTGRIENEKVFRSGKEYDYEIRSIVDPDVKVSFRGEIHPWNYDEEDVDPRLPNVVPDSIIPRIRPYIPIYPGVNPPNIEGCYFVDPYETVYCEDQGNGGFDPGDIVTSIYCRFQNQNTGDNTIDFKSMTASGSSTSEGLGAFISGSGNNFTAFFNTYGQSDGISTKTALVISGTKTAGGIANLYRAFIMVEKGDDPNNRLMKEGVFRVFHDQDGLSVNSEWPGDVKEFRPEAKEWAAPWTNLSEDSYKK